jgi:hypothetical protein
MADFLVYFTVLLEEAEPVRATRMAVEGDWVVFYDDDETMVHAVSSQFARQVTLV